MADVLHNAPVVGMRRRFPRSFGRYILEKSLSRGGMGEVILAVAKGVNRRCVIKTIRGDLVGDDEFVGRFADEAKIMVRISHDNIIRVFDAGKVDSEYYIAMEFVHGRDLGDVLDRAYERGEPMPTQLGLFVTSELLRGLHYAHSLTDERGRHMGLVHRDISPQNVLIGFDGAIKLIDFGLARTEVLPARTQGALAVGKYGYMSPEQARHERIDGRADIYSTGVMLFEVFTGDRLVDEQDQATLWQRVLSPKHRSPRTVVPSLPKEIDELVMSAVGVRPEDRFQDARAMLEFVERMRRPESNRDAFIRYLRYLYPKVDFSPPPMPAFDDLVDIGHEEKSVIIATSREGALSVFGRGELPIEWTRQIASEEINKQLRRRRSETGRAYGRSLSNDFSREQVVTDSHETEAGQVDTLNPDLVGATFIRDGLHEPSTGSLDAPTQVAHYPIDPRTAASDEATRFTRPPSPTDDIPGGPDATLQSAPVNLGVSAASAAYRDDEMTVMMDAPPRLGLPQAPMVDETAETPTRLARIPQVEDMDQSPVMLPANGPNNPNAPRRAIRELNRVADPAPPPSPRRGLAPETAQERNKRKQFAVHRATVGTDTEPRPAPRRPDPAEETRVPDFADQTLPSHESKPVNYLIPGAILFGLAILVVVV
ncbi:MAG: serine/threonine protein kinase, partial [Myxococcales bacterium]|nr:serine/threonine protein kinase [Myxococcales bacterium]